MKPHFGVDVDGVLAHHLPAMLEIVTELTGMTVTPDQVTDYYFAGLVSRELMERVFERCMECAMDLPPMADYHLVNELPGTVTIVTHRPAEAAEETTKEWLRRHGIRYDGIIFTRGPKSQTGRFDYFIDDALRTPSTWPRRAPRLTSWRGRTTGKATSASMITGSCAWGAGRTSRPTSNPLTRGATGSASSASSEREGAVSPA